MVKRHLLTAAILGIGGIGLVALPAAAQEQANPQAQPSAGRGATAQPPLAESSSDLSGSAQAAGDRAAQTGAGAVSQSDARQALSQSAQAVLGDGGLAGLKQQISQRDQQRLGDLSQADPQLTQTVQQLRQAYKEKYQQDLDLSQNAEQVFTAEFFRIGGDASDQARQASDRQAPSGATADPNSAAGATGATGTTDAAGAARPSHAEAGTSGGTGAAAPAGASGTAAGAGADVSGDLAQTAGSSVGKTIVVIPASHGMQEARVSLVNEAGQWKIDVPDNIDAKQLGQKLRQQLQQSAQSKDKWPADATEGQRAIAHAILVAFAEADAAAGAGASGSSGTTGGTGAKR